MKKYALLTLMGLFTICSCNKQQTYSDVRVDVFVRTLKVNKIDSYSTVFSVLSNSQLSGVTVDVPNGTSIALSDQYGNGLYFDKDTSLTTETYSRVPPPSGLYTFHLNYTDGTQKIYTNSLGSDYLLPPVIDSLYRKSNGLIVRLKWEPVTGADAYQMRISSGHNEIVPWVEYGSATQLFYEQLISSLSPWLPGTITFEIRGIKYESDKNYMQAISYTSADIDL